MRKLFFLLAALLVLAAPTFANVVDLGSYDVSIGSNTLWQSIGSFPGSYALDPLVFDLVLLENPVGGTDPLNWSDVVRFTGTSVTQLIGTDIQTTNTQFATLYSDSQGPFDNSFTLQPNPVFITEDPSGVTSYTATGTTLLTTYTFTVFVHSEEVPEPASGLLLAVGALAIRKRKK